MPIEWREPHPIWIADVLILPSSQRHPHLNLYQINGIYRTIILRGRVISSSFNVKFKMFNAFPGLIELGNLERYGGIMTLMGRQNILHISQFL